MKVGLNMMARFVWPSRSARPAFTLVELMIVIFILAVLVAIIVSISGYVTNKANEKDTAITQAILMNAIQAWRDKDTNNPKRYPTITNEANSPQELIDQLTGNAAAGMTLDDPRVKAATEILLKLSKEAWPNSSRPVLDGWGNAMQYSSTGGLGGMPVIISHGPDTSRDDDDIRSDEAE